MVSKVALVSQASFNLISYKSRIYGRGNLWRFFIFIAKGLQHLIIFIYSAITPMGAGTHPPRGFRWIIEYLTGKGKNAAAYADGTHFGDNKND